MLNQTVLVGRLAQDPEVKELEDGKSVSNITLAVPRSYKNAEGEYDTDFINCELWNGVAQNTSEYCKKGDLVGVKGRIQADRYEDKETGEKKYTTKVVVDKVTFLASKKHDEEIESTKEDDKDIEI